MKKLGSIPAFEVEFDVESIEDQKREFLEEELDPANTDPAAEKAKSILSSLECEEWRPIVRPNIWEDDFKQYGTEGEAFIETVREMIEEEDGTDKILFYDPERNFEAVYSVGLGGATDSKLEPDKEEVNVNFYPVFGNEIYINRGTEQVEYGFFDLTFVRKKAKKAAAA